MFYRNEKAKKNSRNGDFVSDFHSFSQHSRRDASRLV